MVLEGMYQGANTHQYGTTRHIKMPDGSYETTFNVEGVRVMGKSGTADPGHRHIDLNMDGIRDPGEMDLAPRDHAWVVALVQPEGASRPTHVVVVVAEYAGSGGRVSGPIANQIIHALKRHGYLAWPPVR